MQYPAKTIRVLTAPPFLATVLLTVATFGNLTLLRPFYFYWGLATLVGLPLVAYPVSWTVNQSRRRAFQRGLAVVLSVVGYLTAWLVALFSSANSTETVLFSTYLFSGVLIAFSSFILHFKASGHTCGIAGPIVYLSFYCGWYYGFGLLLLVPVFWASVKTGRHTVWQLFGGVAVSVIAFVLALQIFG